jgi:hypothetical protein
VKIIKKEEKIVKGKGEKSDGCPLAVIYGSEHGGALPLLGCHDLLHHCLAAGLGILSAFKPYRITVSVK